jgi:hypothetical protein
MAKTEKKRGIWLTIWLYILLISGIITLFSNFLLRGFMATAYTNATSWTWAVFEVIILANIVFIIFLFRWKKWAFFAFCGTAAASFIINIFIGVDIDIFMALTGFASLLILYLSMKSRWDLFE